MLVVHLTVDDSGLIRDVAFEGKGCAISIASASLMTETMKGKTEDEARALFDSFHEMCTKDDFDPGAANGDVDALERLQVLSGAASGAGYPKGFFSCIDLFTRSLRFLCRPWPRSWCARPAWRT